MTPTPVIHLTDLYCPPEDPDDTLDLATLHALPDVEIRAVVLDATTRHLRARRDGGANIAREPGLATVLQLQHLTGRCYPVATGPADPLRDETDQCRDRRLGEQAGIELILQVLRTADEPVVISVVSSLRPLVAAYNREPDLCRAKIDRVLLNAGNAAPGPGGEWNVQLDPHAYAAVWKTGLRIDWYPCGAAGGSFATDEHNTHWSADLGALLGDLPAPLRAWLQYSFGGSGRGDLLRSLHELGEGEAWAMLLAGRRHMWSTAALAAAAGLTARRSAAGWRFLPARGDGEDLFTMQPVHVEATGSDICWRAAEHETPVRLFRRRVGHDAVDHDRAMTEALHDLLDGLPVDPPLA